MKHTPTVLTIAGSDPYAGAGMQADLKAIHACGGYALTAITALTAQNSQGVHSVQAVDSAMLHQQIEALLHDIQIDAIKIGMIANAAQISVIATLLRQHPTIPVVLDTPIVSSSGHALMQADAIAHFKAELLPRATLLTPNLPEAQLLTQQHSDDFPTLAAGFETLYSQAVLIKGGHSVDSKQACDALFIRQDGKLTPAGKFCSERIITEHSHGTGCSLASAIATYIAQEKNLETAIANAKERLQQWLKNGDTLGLSYRQTQRERKQSRKQPLKHL